MSVRRRNRDVVMDPAKTGIVWARKRPHPNRQLFASIPVHWPDHPEAEIPPAEMPPEMMQILAIHVFDNLRCMTPEQVTALLRTVLEELHDDVNSLWSVDDVLAEHAPGGPVYKLAKNPRHTDETAPMGTGGSMWVPMSTPDDQFEPVVEDDDEDIEAIPYAEMTDKQREKLQARLDEHHLAKARIDNLDVPVAPSEPVRAQWQIDRDEMINRLEAKAAATEPEEGPAL